VKYFVSATPGPMPPTPEQFDASIAWLEGKLDDGTFGLSTWEVRPLLEFKEGLDTNRAKLVEAQEAMGGS
jgi:hypothetical protein